MDRERLRISAHVSWVRLRSAIRTGIRLAALALVLLGMYNLFAPVAIDATAIRPYPAGRIVYAETGRFFLADAVAIGGGSIVAWIV